MRAPRCLLEGSLPAAAARRSAAAARTRPARHHHGQTCCSTRRCRPASTSRPHGGATGRPPRRSAPSRHHRACANNVVSLRAPPLRVHGIDRMAGGVGRRSRRRAAEAGPRLGARGMEKHDREGGRRLSDSLGPGLPGLRESRRPLTVELSVQGRVARGEWQCAPSVSIIVSAVSNKI